MIIHSSRPPPFLFFTPDNIYEQLSNLFIRESRHKRISVCFLTQNIFFKGNSSAASHARTCMINATSVNTFFGDRSQDISYEIPKILIFISIIFFCFTARYLSDFKRSKNNPQFSNPNISIKSEVVS